MVNCHAPVAQLGLYDIAHDGMADAHTHLRGCKAGIQFQAASQAVGGDPQGQPDSEPGADAGGADQYDLATHFIQQPADNRQAQPAAAVVASDAAIALAKHLEDLWLDSKGDADTGIPHLNFQGETGACAEARSRAQLNLAPGSKFRGVREQVVEYLPQTAGIAHGPTGQVWRRRADDLHPLGHGLRSDKLQDIVEEATQVEGDMFQFQMPGLDLGQVEHVADEIPQGCR